MNVILQILNYFISIFTVKDRQKSNIDDEALNIAYSDIINSEGYRRDVYKDSLGKLTVGVGHLVLPADNLTLGQRISDRDIEYFFSRDIEKSFVAARVQAMELNKYSSEMIAALISVNFQLGTNWRNKFPNTWLAIKGGSIGDATLRLKRSLWNKQTPNRVASFISTLKKEYA